MASINTIENIKNTIAEITSEPIDALITNQTKWGPLNFESSRIDLDLIFNLCHHLANLPIEILPENTANSVLGAINGCKAEVDKIRTFSIENNTNPTQQKDEIVGHIKRVGEALLIATQGWIPFLAFQKGDIQKNIAELNSAVSVAKGLIEAANVDIALKKKALEDIVSAARDASATVGVAHFTADFSSKEEKLEGEAKNWLIATAIFGLITVSAAAGSFFIPLPSDSGSAGLVQFFTSKIILLAILLTATIWCGRIYKAIKHQAATNNHRANALKSFQAFVNATSDESTKNAVLLETTRSIFAIGSTGYLDPTEAGSDSGMKIMEIIKNSAPIVKG
jgi:hypothetical protein